MSSGNYWNHKKFQDEVEVVKSGLNFSECYASAKEISLTFDPSSRWNLLCSGVLLDEAPFVVQGSILVL